MPARWLASPFACSEIDHFQCRQAVELQIIAGWQIVQLVDDGANIQVAVIRLNALGPLISLIPHDFWSPEK